MDEIIVRVLRAVACFARLRILSCLAAEAELPPTRIARQLGTALGLVSGHMARLSAAGLVMRRRSGTWCYCKAQSPYTRGALSERVSAWLRGALAAPRDAMREIPRTEELRKAPLPEVQAKLHVLIFDAATAFTNVRRLQILRRLCNGKILGIDALSRELKMSESAASRHMAKLVKRGYAEATGPGRKIAYRLARGSKTPLHRQLLRIVRSQWERGNERTGRQGKARMNPGVR